MAIKTFNIQEDAYRKFSNFCKERGMSMSKQVEFFMRSVIEEEPKVKKQYLEKLENIRKQKSIQITNFKQRYGL